MIRHLSLYGREGSASETVRKLIKTFGMSEAVLCKTRDGLIRKEVLVEEQVAVNKKGRLRKGFYLSESFKDKLDLWVSDNEYDDESFTLPHHDLINQILFDENSFPLDIDDEPEQEQEGSASVSKFNNPTEQILKLKPINKVFLVVLLANADERGVVDSLGGADIRNRTLMKRDRLQSQLDKLKRAGLILSVVPGVTSGKLYGRCKAVYVLNLMWDGFSKPVIPDLFLLHQAHENMLKLPQEAEAICEQASKVRSIGNVVVDYTAQKVGKDLGDGVVYVASNDEQYPDVDYVYIRSGPRVLGSGFKTSASGHPLFMRFYESVGLFSESSVLDIASALQWKLDEFAVSILCDNWDLLGNKKRHETYEEVCSQIDDDLLADFKRQFGLTQAEEDNETKDLLVEILISFSYQIATWLYGWLVSLGGRVDIEKLKQGRVLLLPKITQKDLMSFCLLVFSQEDSDGEGKLALSKNSGGRTELELFESIAEVDAELASKYGFVKTEGEAE